MGRLNIDAVIRAFRRSDSARPRRPNRSLERELYGWQIFNILISGIIGGLIIFGGDGEYLRTAGPAGYMTAIVYVGVNAISVMEGISEMIVLWPVSNAMVEFVRTFVDEDLALVVGLAYWHVLQNLTDSTISDRYRYSWSSFIATMFVVAANSATYWNMPNFWQTTVYYILGPIVILCINWMGVKWYGWVEGLVGIVKLFFVIAGALFLLVIGAHNGSKFINAGYDADKRVAANQSSAVLLIIPYITYGFTGVETVTVAAFEARDPRSLRASAKWIAYVITFLFILCGIGSILNISWDDPHLPELVERRDVVQPRDISQSVAHSSLLVLSALINNHKYAAEVWNGFLILSSLSAANTCLYVASRTLYGLCRDLPQDKASWFRRWPAKLGALDPRTRVPFWALIASTAVFFWLPFLHLQKGTSAQDLLDVMITIGSVGCVLVWASQCLVFIRYFNWMRTHKDVLDQLKEEDPLTYGRYDRENPNKGERFHSLLSPTQPAPAYIGLVMCLLTIFIFGSATWWKNDATFKKVAIAYTGPVACGILYVALKAYRFYRTGAKPRLTNLSCNPRRFQEIINHYEALLYLREDDLVAGDGTAAVITEYGGQPAMVMNGVPREPNPPEAVHWRTSGIVVGAGGELNVAAMRIPASATQSGNTQEMATRADVMLGPLSAR